MTGRRASYLLIALFLLEVGGRTLAQAQLITGGESLMGKFHPFQTVDPEQPISVVEVSRRLDCISERLRNDGLVVIKQPDVFSQARMTHFRTDFEDTMKTDLKMFHLVLAARINRLDAATTTQSTSLSAALSAPGTTHVAPPAAPTLPASGMVAPGTSANLDPTKNAFSQIGLDANSPSPTAALALGVDPTVYLDEKKRFLEHLNQIRRINHGPDQNDSSGYGLYLIRLPVSITPGECTYQGHGAELALTVEHEFPTDFLQSSFRNLVINDLVDQLAPVVYEVLRSGLIDKLELLHNQEILFRRLEAQKKQSLVKLYKKFGKQEQVFNNKKNDVQTEFVQPLANFILRDPSSYPSSARGAGSAATIDRRVGALVQSMRDLSVFPTTVLPTELVEMESLLDQARQRLAKGIAATDDDWLNVESCINWFLSKISKIDLASAAGTNPQTQTAFEGLFESLYENSLDDDRHTIDKVIGTDAQSSKQMVDLAASIKAGKATKNNLKLSLPSTRNPKARYPIAPQEVLDFFLEDNIYLLAADARNAAITKNPRATDIRAYLRHSLYMAYDVMSKVRPGVPAPAVLDNTDLMERIYDAVKGREFGPEGSLNGLFQELVGQVQLGRRNILDDQGRSYRPIAALCWAIALDAGLLDAALRAWIPKVFDANQVAFEIAPDMHFYVQDDARLALAQPVFNDFVKFRWPIITFALDPVSDQQNVADSFSLQRDLQLALSFAFATGQVNFSQLNTFRRQIQQSSDTIALNRTVTGFIHDNNNFGFRFTPRFQNPPNQRTNLSVIASQLISGGPGPDYQIRKSKLEPGIRELTAVLLLPTFMPTMRMEVSSNWFKLNDPEHLVFHTKRMLERGREVQDLRRAVLDACGLEEYRTADLNVLRAKLSQLEAMLPAQSKVIQLPFENTASGFDLLSDGATALVPELAGYDGADLYQAGGTNPTDIFVYGKYFDLLDTRVIVGGAYVPPAASNAGAGKGSFEILSREVVRVQIPPTAQPTVTFDDKTYLEVYIATPTGISNRLLIPYQAEAPVPKVAFDLKSTELTIFYSWQKSADGTLKLVATMDPGAVNQNPLQISWDSPVGLAPKTLQVTFSGVAGGQVINFALPANSGTTDEYGVDRQVLAVCLLEQIQNPATAPAVIQDPVTLNLTVQPYVPHDTMGYRVQTGAKKLKTPLKVRLVPKAGQNVLEHVICPHTDADGKHAAAEPGREIRDDGAHADRSLRTTSLVRPARAFAGADAEMASAPPGGFSLPKLSAVEAEITGGIPPIPSEPIPPASNLAASLAAGAAKQFENTATPPVPPGGAPGVPPIVVTPAPVVVISKPPLPPDKPRSRLRRLFDHGQNGRPAPPQSQR